MSTSAERKSAPQGALFRFRDWLALEGVVVGLIALGYVGGYVAARQSGQLWEFEFAFHASPAGIGDPLDTAETFIVSEGDNRVAALFLRCIVVEEWGLNL